MLRDFVKLLLESGADPNATTECEKRSPILIACMNKDYEIMKQLLSSAKNNKLDVNVTDAKGNTPLHYVSITEHLDCVVDLMRCGADMGKKNIFDKSPLPENSVENFLDICLQTNGTPPDNEGYEIIFDYSFLLAHKGKGTQQNLPQGEQLLTHDHESGVRNVQFPEKLKTEMDFLFYMSQSAEHRKLLLHPIIKSFVHMKWQCVKIYFYLNICIYFIFAVLLNAYILLIIGDNATNGSEAMITSNEPKTYKSNLIKFAWVVILTVLPYLTVREFLQFVLSPKVYFANYENILDSLVMLHIIFV
jgi:hypothetical protein